MKINHDIIIKIFNNKLILKKKTDIMELSNYNEYIPMFDIYSLKIYPIKNTNIHFRMIDCHYRFINKEVVDWMGNIVKKKKEGYMIVKKNLEILKNYHIESLYETSVNTFFKYSPKFGLEISICKRNSFHPNMPHITPYYSKKELIKLGMNMNIISEKSDYDLLDQKTHYKICKQISKNDVSINTILEHSKYIMNNKAIQVINDYSLHGSFMMNKLLRKFSIDSQYYNPQQVKNICSLASLINKSPKLPKDFYFYRFIWEDDFLLGLKEGDVFIDNGFTSTTRDPFYSPGTDYNFGLVLLKINIPKDVPGIGLFIENFSFFPIEEEFLLAPGNKLKLTKKDDKFKYYHLNPKFERLVTKKYEFTWVGKDNDILKKIKVNPEFSFNLNPVTINSKIEGDTIIRRLEYLVKNYSSNYHIKIKDYVLKINWFDGNSSYKDFYYNNNEKGLIFNLMEGNNIITSIECGDKMIINYLLKKFYNDNKTKKVFDLYHMIAKIIGYEKFIINDTFNSGSKEFYKINRKYNVDLENYLTKGKYDQIKFGTREVGSLKLKIIFNNVNTELNKKYGTNLKHTLGELYLYMIKNNYYYLQKILDYLIENNGEEINFTLVDSRSYWESKNETFDNYMNNSKKEEEYNTSFNRRRVR